MNWVGFILVGIVASGMLALTITLPLTTQAPHVPMPMLSFETSTNPNDHYQQQICACKQDWQLASNERLISNQYFGGGEPFVQDPLKHSSYAWAWGQFIDHDIVRSETTPADGTFHIQMVPYDVNLTMHRAVARPTSSGPECREPKMHETAKIDGSTVYGDYLSAPNLLTRLRDEGDGCKLKHIAGPDGALLTLDELKPGNFLAGDPRNTEHVLLNSLHVIWMREHNRLCDYLANGIAQTQNWTPNQRFWKVRQIVVAKIQHITYAEWLPSLFGSTQVKLLHDNDSGFPELGHETRMVRPFAVAAYRMGHSMVNNNLGSFELRELFFNASLIQSQGINGFLQAAYDTPALRVDTHVVPGLRDLLFAMPGAMVGEDLVTRNLFRGRDVGMGTYNDIAHCYGQTPQNVFKDPIHGLLAEPVVEGSSLPRTAAIIIAEQFRRLRKYDSQYYTKIINDGIGTIFSAEIFGATLARVINENTGPSLDLPMDVFRHEM